MNAKEKLQSALMLTPFYKLPKIPELNSVMCGDDAAEAIMAWIKTLTPEQFSEAWQEYVKDE